MHRRSLLSLASLIALAACASPGSQSLAPQSSARAALAAAAPALHAHWTRTSLGRFADPYSVAVNPYCAHNCSVYVSDPGSKLVYKIAPDGAIRPIAHITAAGFDPQGIAVQSEPPSGNDRVYIADKAPGNETRVWEVNIYGNAYVCCAGRNDYFASYPLFNRDVAVYAPPGKGFALYAAQATHLPHKTPGQVACRGTSSDCQIFRTTFSDPYGVAVDGNGALYVADARDKRAYRVVGGNATDLGKVFGDPYGIAASLDGSTVYVADAGDKCVWERLADGTWRVVERFADPYSVAVDASGTLYVADPGSKEVYKLTP